jgi:hypothetical protein
MAGLGPGATPWLARADIRIKWPLPGGGSILSENDKKRPRVVDAPEPFP